MRLKLYRASSIADAMSLVRRELGVEAIILSSRKVADGVEVTAALDDPPLQLPPSRDAMTMRALSYHNVPPRLAEVLGQGPLSQALAVNIAFEAIPLLDRPLLFTGPPGAGKTLTVARLATRLVLGGVRPMVITADERRAGAAEQLAAYTRLLGLDLIVAHNPIAVARALARRTTATPVLIDLPAASPFDHAQVDELTALTTTANGRVALVLPAGIDAIEAGEIASAFVEATATLLVVTKLDVARRIGCVLSAASKGLALTEAGIGPGAADGMVAFSSELLCARLLDVPPEWEPS